MAGRKKGQPKTETPKKQNKKKVAAKGRTKSEKKKQPQKKGNKQTKASKKPPPHQGPIPVVRNEPTADESFEADEAEASDGENDPIVTEEDDKKRWKKGELFTVGRTIRFVKSQQAAKTVLAKKLRKWREAQKALFKKNYKRSIRAIYQKWTRLTADWRAMFDLSLGNTASGGARRGVDYRFLADYQEFISPLTEATKPSFVMETQKKRGFVAPLKLNTSVAYGQETPFGHKSQLGDLERNDEEEYEDYDERLEQGKDVSDGLQTKRNDPAEVETAGRSMEDNFDDLGTGDAPFEELEQSGEQIESETDENEVPSHTMNESAPGENTQIGGSGWRGDFRTIVIDSPSPEYDGTEIQDLYRMTKKTPKIESTQTNVREKIVKGQMMLMECDEIYDRTTAPHLRPGDLVPVVVIGTHRNNIYDISTLDLERIPDVPRNKFKGIVRNPQDFSPNDCMEQKMMFMQPVYLRDGAEEDHPDIKRMGPALARQVKYYVLGGFENGAIIGRKPPGKEESSIFKTILRRKAQEIISCENRIPVQMSMPSNIDIRPKNYSNEELNNLKAKLANSKRAEKDDVKFGEAVSLGGGQIHFCVVDALLENIGPLLLAPDGTRAPLKDLPKRDDRPKIMPGDQQTVGADEIEMFRGDSVIFVKDGNVEDFGTVINIADDHVLIQSHREGAYARYERVLNVQCRQMNKVVTANYQELREAIRTRRQKDQEPVFVHPRPTVFFETGTEDGPTDNEQIHRQDTTSPGRAMDEEGTNETEAETAGDRIDQLLNDILKRNAKEKRSADEKGKDEPKKPPDNKDKKKGRRRRKDPYSDDDDDPETKKSKQFAKEVGAVLLPGFQDIFTGYWRDKRNYATDTHNRSQMHATTQIQSAMQFLIESRRAELARHERLLVELMRMAAVRQDAMMKMLNLMTRILCGNDRSKTDCATGEQNQQQEKENGPEATTIMEEFLRQMQTNTVPGQENLEQEPHRTMDVDEGGPQNQSKKPDAKPPDKTQK